MGLIRGLIVHFFDEEEKKNVNAISFYDGFVVISF